MRREKTPFLWNISPLFDFATSIKCEDEPQSITTNHSAAPFTLHSKDKRGFSIKSECNLYLGNEVGIDNGAGDGELTIIIWVRITVECV